jgi:hypothetical protein
MPTVNEELTENEIIERYLILLLGIVDKPVPSPEHLQKELFIMSRANPKAANFIKFEKHYKGPYSIDIEELIKNPLYYKDAYRCYAQDIIQITPRGKEIYNQLVEHYSKNDKFKEFLGILKMIRDFYDRLSKDELLFLMYVTYPEYKEYSRISEKLLSKKREIAKGLLDKRIITEKRFLEIIESNE